MSDDFGVDDITAIREEEGAAGIKALMRAQLAIGKARRQQPATKPARRATGRPPGAWPTGTRPPDPLPSTHPPSAWTAALDEHRQWLTATDHPEHADNGQICGCPGCRPTRKDHR